MVKNNPFRLEEVLQNSIFIMLMNEPQEDLDEKYQNVFADTTKGNSIHISQAESGRKGYFCQGCGKQLEAVRHKVPNRIDYFRHVPMDVKHDQKCTYRDETYRHKLAKEALGRLKHIKVPAVYKFPSKGEEGLANLLVESILIEAHSVEMERTFYEDESGEIKWGSGQGVDEKYLLIRPDVVFFDIDKKPLLLIELVATHKPDNEKKAKLRRLGINAIQVSIPKDTEAAIEAALYNTKRIKWLYNNVEQSTTYVSVPFSTSEGISQIDEQQKRFFAETFECRQAEVRNLIRTITRVLESKQFGEVIKQLGDDLSRVKGNTEEHQSKLDGLREEYRNRAVKSVESEEEEFAKKFDDFNKQQTEFQKYSWELETRYFAKRSSLKSDQESINSIANGESQGRGGTAIGIESRRREVERAKAEIEELIRKEESEIAKLEREENGLPERFEQLRESVITKFATIEGNEKREMEELGLEEAGLPKEFEEKEGKLSGEYKQLEDELREQFEKSREYTDKIIMSRDGKGNTKLHYRIRGLLEARELLDDSSKAQSYNQRNRKAWRAYQDGTYKDWIE